MFNGKLKVTPEVIAFMELRPYFRFCPECGEGLGAECIEHDPCIRNCPGTDDACCGHGIDDAAYVSLRTGFLTGESAHAYFAENGLGWRTWIE